MVGEAQEKFHALGYLNGNLHFLLSNRLQTQRSKFSGQVSPDEYLLGFVSTSQRVFWWSLQISDENPQQVGALPEIFRAGTVSDVANDKLGQVIKAIELVVGSGRNVKKDSSLNQVQEVAERKVMDAIRSN